MHIYSFIREIFKPGLHLKFNYATMYNGEQYKQNS